VEDLDGEIAEKALGLGAGLGFAQLLAQIE
jgi:hypothetical protein